MSYITRLIFFLLVAHHIELAHAGKIYDVLKECSEREFRQKAIQSVITKFENEKLPLPGNENYTSENSKKYMEEFEQAIQYTKNEWKSVALGRLKGLTRQRINTIDILLVQFNMTKYTAGKEDILLEKFSRFFEKKVEYLQYAMNGYVEDVLLKQSANDKNGMFAQSTNPFGTYARFLGGKHHEEANLYAAKKYILYHNMNEYLLRNQLTFSSHTSKILDSLLLKRVNDYIERNIVEQRNILIQEYQSNFEPLKQQFINTIESPEIRGTKLQLRFLDSFTISKATDSWMNDKFKSPLFSADETFNKKISDSTVQQQSNNFTLKSFSELYNEKESLENYLQEKASKWLKRTDFYGDSITSTIQLDEWLKKVINNPPRQEGKVNEKTALVNELVEILMPALNDKREITD